MAPLKGTDAYYRMTHRPQHTTHPVHVTKIRKKNTPGQTSTRWQHGAGRGSTWRRCPRKTRTSPSASRAGDHDGLQDGSQAQSRSRVSACHEQTGGVPNDALGVRVRAQCAGGRLGSWKGGSEGAEAMVLEATVTSLEKVSNSTFSLVCPKTPKMLKIVEIAMFCSGDLRPLGLRGRILRRRNVFRSASLLRD